MQHSRISRCQLLTIGFSRSAIGRRLNAGALHLIHRAVYAVGPRVEVELGDETAALLAVGEPVALSHESAAQLWRIWPEKADAVHVTVPGDRAKSRRGIVVHRSSRISRAEVTTHRGLPVTTAVRAVLDLADRHPPRLVERVFDEALALRLVSPTKVRDQIARSPGRKGTPLLMKLIDPERGRGVSIREAEDRLLGLIRRARLPDPDRNVTVGPFCFDLLWRAHGVAVEFDSVRWHTTRSSFLRDRAKDAYARDHGIDLHRVTWPMLEDPVPLVARLTRAIAVYGSG